MRFLVASGSSGGHIFPALSFARRLKDAKPDAEILLVLPQKNIGVTLDSSLCSIRYICVRSIGDKINLAAFLSLFRFIKGSAQSIFMLMEFRPDAVVGFGSLASIPLVFFAWVFRIKTLIHEQNVIPGRSTRLLAKFADKVAVSFPDTVNYLCASKSKIVVTGNPLRPELERIERLSALSFFGLSENKFTILVLGGSQGSRRINAIFLEAATLLKDKNSFQVIHIAGVVDYDSIASAYRRLGIESRVFPFSNKMQFAYSASDLAVSRAGAATITELEFFKIPAIIIPYPFAHGHQLKNAQVLSAKQAALVIQEKDLTVELLFTELNRLFTNGPELEKMRLGFKEENNTRAGELLVNEVLVLSGYRS